MKAAGLRGISRAKGPRTTIPGSGPDTRPDLVRAGVHRDRPGPAVGRRHHLLPHLRRLGLCRVRHRRVLPPGGGLAAVEEPAHRPGAGRPGDGPLDPRPGRPRHHRADPPLGQGRSIRRRSLHPAPRRRRGSRLGRVYRRLLRQRAGRGVQLAVQGRAGPQQGTLAAPSTTSRSRSPSTSTGSTTDACTARSAPSHPSSSRTTTTGTTPPRLPSRRQFRASTEPGTGQPLSCLLCAAIPGERRGGSERTPNGRLRSACGQGLPAPQSCCGHFARGPAHRATEQSRHSGAGTTERLESHSRRLAAASAASSRA